MIEASTHQAQLLSPCMSPRAPRTMVDPWPTTGNETIGKFFMLTIDTFAMYIGSKWALVY